MEEVVIKDFSGGLVTNADYLDLKENQFSEFSFDNSKEGMIVSIVGNANTLLETSSTEPYLKLLSKVKNFYMDKDLDGNEAETQYLAYVRSDGKTEIREDVDSSGTKILTTQITDGFYGDVVNGYNKDTIFVAYENKLRVYNNDNNGQNIIRINIKNKKFFNNAYTWGTDEENGGDNDSNYGSDGAGWYNCPNIIGNNYLRIATDDHNSISENKGYGLFYYMVYGQASDNEAGWTTDEMPSFYFSLVYENGQESKPMPITPSNSPYTYNIINIRFYLNKYFNRRIEGISIYKRDNGYGGEDYDYLGTIDINDSGWTLETSKVAHHYYTITKYNFNTVVDTYYSRNGYLFPADYGDNGAKIYNSKDVIITYNRTFWANVEYYYGGRYVKQNSRIVYSPLNKYDIFLPTVNYIDVGNDDGEEIKAIVEYRGILHVFKRTRLYLIDISNSNPLNWKLVRIYENSGIIDRTHIVKTDYGLIFYSNKRIMLFDTDLKEISLPIKNDLEDNTINFTPIGIGYDYRRNLIVAAFTYQDQQMYYILNLNSMSWSKKVYTTSTLAIATNLFYDYYDQSLKYLYEIQSDTTYYLYVRALFRSGTYMGGTITKYIDCGNPKLKKKFLRFRILGKGNLSVYVYNSSDNLITSDSYNLATLQNVELNVLYADYFIKFVINTTGSCEIREIGISYRYMRNVK